MKVTQQLQAVIFKYKELADVSSQLGPRIEQAFGPKGMGICMVSDIPNYVEFRQRLLPLAYKLGNLPKEKLQQYERPENLYAKGWSCGVEKFKGQLDHSKGSFYNNPNFDEDWDGPTDTQQTANVWPHDTIPEMEAAFKSLGRLMVDVGAMLAYHIDQYVSSQVSTYRKGTLYRYIREGDQHLGRLLHYFPQKEDLNDWCGWHNDHSALTALTAPIYLDNKGVQVENFSDPTGGLMAKNRYADITKISIQQDCLAFQIGETLQIVTGGYVEATPHCVIGGEKARSLGLNRNTFAVFMAPRGDTLLNIPSGITPEQAMNKEAYNVPSLINRWRENIPFSEYSLNSFKAYANN